MSDERTLRLHLGKTVAMARYTGVTSDLIKRVFEHRIDAMPGFTKAYGVHVLVWFELHGTMAAAISREKAIKGWKRA